MASAVLPAEKMMYRQQRLEEFVEAMAAKTATPGGGSAAALAAAMAAGLEAMVIQFSIKKASPAQLKKLEALLGEAQALRQRLLQLVDEDSLAYERLRQAYKSQQGVQEATVGATAVPLETAQLAMKALSFGRDLLTIGNPKLLSDVGVAASLAFAAIQGACMNVAINITSLEDRRAKAKFSRQMESLIQKSRVTALPLLSMIHRRMV